MKRISQEGSSVSNPRLSEHDRTTTSSAPATTTTVFKPVALWASVILVVEFFGGLAMMLGLYTWLAAALFGVEMATGTVWKVAKAGKPLTDYSYDLQLLALWLVLLAFGPGVYSPCVRRALGSRAEPGEDDVAERDDLRLRQREGLQRHQVEVAHAELRRLEDAGGAVGRRADEPDRVAELGGNLVGDERRRRDGGLPVVGVGEVGIDPVHGVGHLELRAA